MKEIENRIDPFRVLVLVIAAVAIAAIGITLQPGGTEFLARFVR